MLLKQKLTTLEGLDAAFHSLYTEQSDGSFLLTGVEGMKTQSDIDKVTQALIKERGDHKATKAKFELLGDQDPVDLLAQLDRIKELEAAAGGKIDETELKIFFPNDTTISVLGLDEPARIEGSPWTGGGIDEFGNIKDGAWEENIMPALDTIDPRRPDYRAWCWLFGVPEGMNHYYDRCDYASSANDPLWKLFHWKSAEILPLDVIEAAKRVLSPRQFRQEYEASFETADGKIYEDYSSANHTQELIKPHERLMWHHDFNYTPLSSGIAVERNNKIFILDEIILTSAIARQSALEFVERYQAHQNKTVIIYGDPAGRAGEKHGHSSDYTEIENVLRNNGWSFQRRVKPAAPAIKDRQNAVRAKILNAVGSTSLFVNPAKAPYAHKGLATVQFKKGSTFLEEDSQYQHITTAIGYMVDYEYPVIHVPSQSRTYGT